MAISKLHMLFGVYFHIPHCLQVCPYCDFTKYEFSKILPPEEYVSLVVNEIRQRAGFISPRTIHSIYFGGGTPSLLEPRLILALLDELANQGFRRDQAAEFTIEVNPATIDEAKLDAYLALGVNRFSIGVQTFSERLLRIAGRKHSVRDTIETLTLLKKRDVNISVDLLFALPTQTIDEVAHDLRQVLSFDPAHLSAYYLTVPEQHPMARGRAPEGEQLAMFDLISDSLRAAGLARYELSSYAKPGLESKHNRLYWTDQDYWGLGVSAHSYLKRDKWGVRFWNPAALPAYIKQINQFASGEANRPWSFDSDLPDHQKEVLLKHQALTDFCHVRLRMIQGLDTNALRLKFGEAVSELVESRMNECEQEGLLEHTAPFWRLTREGRLLSNTVFEKLTFLADDLRS